MNFNLFEAFLLLFATIGPLKVTIVCATLTATASPQRLNVIALRAALIATAVCLAFVVLGEAILMLFKVSVPAFQIGGGLVVLLFSLEMVIGNKEKESAKEGDVAATGASEPSLDLAVYPLAVPLMASVSGLVAIVSLMAQRNDWIAILVISGVITAIMGVNYVCLRACQYIVALVGPITLQVVGKIMGVILTALAVELLLMGFTGAGVLVRATP